MIYSSTLLSVGNMFQDPQGKSQIDSVRLYVYYVFSCTYTPVITVFNLLISTVINNNNNKENCSKSYADVVSISKLPY